MFVVLGKVCIALSLIVSVYAIIISILGIRRHKELLLHAARQALLIVFALLSVASLCLVHEFLVSNFQVEYVYQYSNRTLPLFYKICAFWGGQAGSLLLWAWMLSLFAAVVAIQYRRSTWGVLPYVYPILAVTEVFFLFLVSFFTPPFLLTEATPPDGMGLNPLLQNPGMMWHPPTLFLGYVGYTVPFAFALAALMSRQLGNEWIRAVRRWSLFSWLFLGIGILLGAQWAYVELGWGGYWAWDPVENASLIPWLTGTAFLHSVIVQEKRGMLKTWNLLLIVLTFTLCIFGTFLTRSGIVSSVHSFGSSSIGTYFLGFMVVVLVVSIGFLRANRDLLQDDNEIDSFLSRESSFLLNNLILMGGAFAVLWGTIYPVISQVVSGRKVTVGPDFFNQVMTPIGLALLALTGIGPLIAWKRANKANFRINFRRPLIVTAVGAVILFFTGVRHPGALLAYALCVFVTAATVLEFARGTGAQRDLSGQSLPSSFLALVRRNRRRYGGYVVHLGMVMVFLGITGSSAYKREARQGDRDEIVLKPGESISLDEYLFRHDGVFSRSYPNHEEMGVKLATYRNKVFLGNLIPRINHYGKTMMQEEQSTSEVALRSNLKEDVYVILGSWDESGEVVLKIMVNPLVAWMWIGGILLILGTHVAALPDRRSQAAALQDAVGKKTRAERRQAKQTYLEEALRDLELEYRVAKLTDEDFEEEQARLQASLAEITPKRGAASPAGESIDPIEEEIRKRRSRRGKSA